MNFKKGEVLFFNKPLGWTSFKVVGHVRYHICRQIGVKKLKVGHAGTLDPLATGVMIVCTGKATKRIEEFQYHTKEYVATLQLGATTPSYDLEKEIENVKKWVSEKDNLLKIIDNKKTDIEKKENKKVKKTPGIRVR